jgi:hypothetical protein
VQAFYNGVMTVNTRHTRPLLRIVGALLLGVAVAGVPALSYADHGFGGGGGHMSGGGHFGGGGAHMGGGGHFAGPHYAAGGHYRGYGAPRSGGYRAGYAAHGYHNSAQIGRGGFAPGGGYHGGSGVGFRGGSWGGHPWVGGYWHGGFWPRCWFNPGFAWFLAGLPFGYATYWWGGVPYYYYNDLYYTWSPADSGYVVTEPPPVAGTADDSGDADQASAPAGGPAGGPESGAGGSADVYLYPRNGQTDQQMSNDRYECHSWAVGQTGFDPTRTSGQQSGNDADYRRAMIACLDARGYSAR